jgi:hypothetical protein
MTHKILPSGLHCLVLDTGRIEIYTETEWRHLSWWETVKLKYFS